MQTKDHNIVFQTFTKSINNHHKVPLPLVLHRVHTGVQNEEGLSEQ